MARRLRLISFILAAILPALPCAAQAPAAQPQGIPAALPDTSAGKLPAEIPGFIRNAPGRDAYPDEDGLILRQTVRISLDSQGKVTRHEEAALKMLQEWVARQELLDERINWNDARSSLRLEQARTYMADGTIRDAKANSFVPTTAPELQSAVPYAYLRQMVVAHVGAEHGSTSVLSYTVEDRAPSGVPLWGVMDLQGPLPILEQSVTIEVPEGTAVHWGTLACDLRPQTATRGGVTSTVLERRNVPGANRGELPSGRAGVQRLVFSAAKDWSEVRSFLETRLAPAIAPADGTIRAKTAEIVAGSLLEAEKLSRIHSFVVKGIQAVSWPLAAFDYSARPAAEILNSSVAHGLEKAALLASMLRAAGFEAAVALASPGPEFSADVPSPAQLDEAWVRVRMGPHALWLSPDAPLDARNAWHLAGRSVLVLDGGSAGPQILPELDPSRNRASARVVLTLEDAGREVRLGGTADLDLGGLYNPLVSYDRSKERQARLAESFVAAFGGAKPAQVFVGERSEALTSLRAVFDRGVAEIPGSGQIRLPIPRVPGAISGGSFDIHRQKRTLPLLLPAPATEIVEVVLELPKTLEAAYLPPEISVANPAGSVRRTVSRDGRKLTIRTELSVALPVVTPAAYGHLRALMTALEGDSATAILLRRSG